MRCETLRERVVELVTGELSAADRLGCEAHLAVCLGCRRERDEAARVLAAARAAETADPGDAFWEGFADRVWEQVRAEPVAPMRGPAAWAERLRALLAPRGRAWGLGLAAAAVVAIVAIVIGRGLLRDGGGGGPGATAAPGAAPEDVLALPGGPGVEGGAPLAPAVPGSGDGDGDDDDRGDALFALDEGLPALDSLEGDSVARLADALGREIEDEMDDAAAPIEGVDASDVHEALRGASADELRAIERALEKVSVDDLV